jgi:transposase
LQAPTATRPSRGTARPTRPAWRTWPTTSLEGDDAAVALGLKLWLGSAFALARAITTLAASTIAAKRRALERRLDDLLARATACDLTRAVQDKMRRARNQLLTFALFPGQVEPTNNACERDLRPAVIQRKKTNGYRATWSAEGKADGRTATTLMIQPERQQL